MEEEADVREEQRDSDEDGMGPVESKAKTKNTERKCKLDLAKLPSRISDAWNGADFNAVHVFMEPESKIKQGVTMCLAGIAILILTLLLNFYIKRVTNVYRMQSYAENLIE